MRGARAFRSSLLRSNGEGDRSAKLSGGGAGPSGSRSLATSPSPSATGRIFAAILLLLFVTSPAAAQEKQPPYWASIASGQAMTHTGPGRNYPNVWLYQRRDLPVRVLKKYETWRLIQDPDGAQGWMLVTMLADRRTAIVKPGDPRPIRTGPSYTARIAYQAEQGVVGRISKCSAGWCRIDIGNHRGYIRTSDIWGVGDNEMVD